MFECNFDCYVYVYKLMTELHKNVCDHIVTIIKYQRYRIAGMFGGDKVWRIASLKVVGEKKFGECLQQCCATYKMD